MFINLEGISGDIEFESWEFGGKKSGTVAFGTGAGTGSKYSGNALGDVIITRKPDQFSNLLLKALIENIKYLSGKLAYGTFLSPEDNKVHKYWINLKGISITAINSGQNGGDVVCLTCEDIKIDYEK